MSKYNTLNVMLSNSQINKLKSGIKNGTVIILKISSNGAADSNDENNFPHKLLLTNTHVLRLCKAFANNSSVNIKLSKSQLVKIAQSGRFSDFQIFRLLGPLPKTLLPLIKNVLKSLTKSILYSLGLTAASATYASIDKKMFGSGMATLIISNEEMNDIIKIVDSLEESGLLVTGVGKTIKNKAKEQKGGFLGMLLGTFGASLLENL